MWEGWGWEGGDERAEELVMLGVEVVLGFLEGLDELVFIVDATEDSSVYGEGAGRVVDVADAVRVEVVVQTLDDDVRSCPERFMLLGNVSSGAVDVRPEPHEAADGEILDGVDVLLEGGLESCRKRFLCHDEPHVREHLDRVLHRLGGTVVGIVECRGGPWVTEITAVKNPGG